MEVVIVKRNSFISWMKRSMFLTVLRLRFFCFFFVLGTEFPITLGAITVNCLHGETLTSQKSGVFAKCAEIKTTISKMKAMVPIRGVKSQYCILGGCFVFRLNVVLALGGAAKEATNSS